MTCSTTPPGPKPCQECGSTDKKIGDSKCAKCKDDHERRIQQHRKRIQRDLQNCLECGERFKTNMNWRLKRRTRFCSQTCAKKETEVKVDWLDVQIGKILVLMSKSLKKEEFEYDKTKYSVNFGRISSDMQYHGDYYET